MKAAMRFLIAALLTCGLTIGHPGGTAFADSMNVPLPINPGGNSQDFTGNVFGVTGAVHDGTTNDTAAINAALSKCGAAGGQHDDGCATHG